MSGDWGLVKSGAAASGGDDGGGGGSSDYLPLLAGGATYGAPHDPLTGQTVTLEGGFVYSCLIELPQDVLITQIMFFVTTANNGTSVECGLYTYERVPGTTSTRLGISPAFTANTTGLKGRNLTTPVVVPAGFVQAAITCAGATIAVGAQRELRFQNPTDMAENGSHGGYSRSVAPSSTITPTAVVNGTIHPVMPRLTIYGTPA